MDDSWGDEFSEELTLEDLKKIKQEKTKHRFYWLDAYEDIYHRPGTIFLFGKLHDETTKRNSSCCLRVKNIPRCFYLLPRQLRPTESPSRSAVDEEKLNIGAEQELGMRRVFEKWAKKKSVQAYQWEKVWRSEVLEKDALPQRREYVRVKYGANYPSMEGDYGGSAIERVVGGSIWPLEYFLVEQGIKGPCWLEVEGARPVNEGKTSWCECELECTKMSSIRANLMEFPAPTMLGVTLSVWVTLDPDLGHNRIRAIGILVDNCVEIEALSCDPGTRIDREYCLAIGDKIGQSSSQGENEDFINCQSELDLLERFLAILQNVDPDLVVCQDSGFQLDTLVRRIFCLKVKNWNRLGKLKQSAPSRPIVDGENIYLPHFFSGRPICDVLLSAKELNVKIRSYDLESLGAALLKDNCPGVLEKKGPDHNVVEKDEKNVVEIGKIVEFTMKEARAIVHILAALNVIPLAVDLTRLAGNTLSRSLFGGRLERTEFLLLHAFNEKGFISPDKRSCPEGTPRSRATGQRRKGAYAGGLVLEPKKGLHEDFLILLMDFKSLYPSIIQEFNVCFTTIPGALFIDELPLPDPQLPPGILPTEIQKLVQDRKKIQIMMKCQDLSDQTRTRCDMKQLALKLTANSMYGCLGSPSFRFYAKGLAAFVTEKAREILLNAKTLVENMGYQVIYGDTDSMMIQTNNLNYDDAYAVGLKIKQEVNKLYTSVELEVDRVFRYLLLVRKKKYAAATMKKMPGGNIELSIERKGLDIVRRDWCKLTCDTGNEILDELLSNNSQAKGKIERILEILKNVASRIRENQISVSSLLLTKELSKNPNEYPGKNLAHVIVARRLNSKGGRMWRSGDTVPYIICQDGSSRSAMERAYHVTEFNENENLKIDVDYYIRKQLYPVVSRICESIEGLDGQLLANQLGLEGPGKSSSLVADTMKNEKEIVFPIALDDRWKSCAPLTIKCRNDGCKTEIEVKNFFTDFDSGRLPSLARCKNPNCDTPPWRYAKCIRNQLQNAMRLNIDKYYESSMECDNENCPRKTRHLPIHFFGTYPRCEVCRKGNLRNSYSESKLHDQLRFYHRIFDLRAQGGSTALAEIPPEMESAYNMLAEFVREWLSHNSYSVVDLHL